MVPVVERAVLEALKGLRDLICASTLIQTAFASCGDTVAEFVVSDEEMIFTVKVPRGFVGF